VIISPAVSLGHSIEDLFGADTADPDDLDDLISLYETRLAYRRSLIDSEISLLEQLDSLWTRVLEIEDLEYQPGRWMRNGTRPSASMHTRRAAVTWPISKPGSHPTADSSISPEGHWTPSCRIWQTPRGFSSRLRISRPPHFRRRSGTSRRQSPGSRSDGIFQLPQPVAAVRPGPGPAEDFLEADPAQLSLGVSAKGSAADGRLDSADVSGSVGLQLGNSVGGAFALGYQSTGSGYESPYATFTLTFSNDGGEPSKISNSRSWKRRGRTPS
jgi:hypothetical protein